MIKSLSEREVDKEVMRAVIGVIRDVITIRINENNAVKVAKCFIKC